MCMPFISNTRVSTYGAGCFLLPMLCIFTSVSFIADLWVQSVGRPMEASQQVLYKYLISWNMALNGSKDSKMGWFHSVRTLYMYRNILLMVWLGSKTHPLWHLHTLCWVTFFFLCTWSAQPLPFFSGHIHHLFTLLMSANQRTSICTGTREIEFTKNSKRNIPISQIKRSSLLQQMSVW